MRVNSRTLSRLVLCGIAAALDVILRRSPKFLGPREMLPGKKEESR